MPSQSSVQPPGKLLQSAGTALHWTALRAVADEGAGGAAGAVAGRRQAVVAAQGLPQLATFSFLTPSQSLSRASQISSSAAHPPAQTPAGKVHFHVPAWHATATWLVHSGLLAEGLTPQTWDGVGATTPSSIWPLQLSSTPLQVSCAE